MILNYKASGALDSPKAKELDGKIKEAGEKVRKLKTEKASKEDIDREVKSLLELKQEFKAVTGADWKPDAGQPAARAAPVNLPFYKLFKLGVI